MGIPWDYLLSGLILTRSASSYFYKAKAKEQ